MSIPPDILRRFQCTAFAEGGSGVGSQGNNKFYIIKAWKRPDGLYDFRGEYGKVGDEAKPRIDEKAGVSSYWLEEKANEKLYKKHPPYREISLHTAPVAANTARVAPSVVAPKVQALIDWVLRSAGEAVKSFLKVKVEALNLSQIATGRQQLVQIGQAHVDWRRNPNAANEQRLSNLVMDYFNTIPTVLPRVINRAEVVQDFVNQLADHETRLDRMRGGALCHGVSLAELSVVCSHEMTIYG